MGHGQHSEPPGTKWNRRGSHIRAVCRASELHGGAALGQAGEYWADGINEGFTKEMTFLLDSEGW